MYALGPSQPPAKRKRISGGGYGEEEKASDIQDRLVKPSEVLNFQSPIITILVGDPDDPSKPPTKFQIHSSILTTSSPFFASALKPEWSSQRSDPNTISLPDDDPAAFSLYTTFIYTGKLPILPESSPSPQFPTTDDSTTELSFRNPQDSYSTLSHAYILGEHLLATAFKNAIADAYVQHARGSPALKRRYPTNADIRILYEGTPESSSIRKLLVDIWCVRGRYEWLDQDPDLPNDFLVEVTKGLMKARPSVENLSRPWKKEHLQYHDETAVEMGGEGSG